MSVLKNKVDFAVVISVDNANPNGDPLNGNRPRTTYDDRGEMSDVCIKRKIRNRLQDMGQEIFVVMDGQAKDGCKSLRDRAKANEKLQAVKDDKAKYASVACETWMDVRSFGQVFAFGKKGKDSDDAMSIGIRGPVTIRPAISLDPVDIMSIQISKSVNGETDPKSPDAKASDTLGMKHRVVNGVYVAYGTINPQLASNTGFTEKDAGMIKEALRTLFANDASAARPDGSMEVRNLIWWEHNNSIGQHSSAKVHRSLQFESWNEEPCRFEDYRMKIIPLEGLEPEVIEGL